MIFLDVDMISLDIILLCGALRLNYIGSRLDPCLRAMTCCSYCTVPFRAVKLVRLANLTFASVTQSDMMHQQKDTEGYRYYWNGFNKQHYIGSSEQRPSNNASSCFSVAFAPALLAGSSSAVSEGKRFHHAKQPIG